MNAPVKTPQGPVVALGVPDVQDYPRLVYVAPYFTTVPMADLFAPAVQEAVEGILPVVLPPFVDEAAQNAVNQYAVLLTGSVMTGPLLLWGDPTTPTMAATKNYVDAMLSTAGIPEVPPVPIGQLWARETGQWVPIDSSGGNFLELTGGTMAGPINMSGNQIRGLPTVPTQPDGAASSGWVLQQLAAVSLYQGTWNPATNVPDLTLPVSHQNAYTWICNPVASGGVVVTPAIPGLQGVTVYEGDTIIFSAQSGTFTAIHAGGLSITEADARYLQLTGGQMEGALLLNAPPTQPMQAATMAWVQSLLTTAGIPEAPNDGQNYLRNGSSASWVPGIAASGGIMTGPLTLSGLPSQSNPMGAVPLQMVQIVTGGPLGQVSANSFWRGPLTGQGAPNWGGLATQDFTAATGLIVPVNRGGTGQISFTNGLLQSIGNVFSTTPLPLSPANGGTGIAGAPPAGIVMSNGTVYASQPTPLPISMGGTGNTTGAPGAMPMGVTDGSNAAAGQVGEFIYSTALSPFLGADGSYYNIAEINPLTPGDWMISGWYQIGQNCPYLQVRIYAQGGSINAPIYGFETSGYFVNNLPANGVQTIVLNTFRYNFSAAQAASGINVWLQAAQPFGQGASITAVSGAFWAWRMR